MIVEKLSDKKLYVLKIFEREVKTITESLDIYTLLC